MKMRNEYIIVGDTEKYNACLIRVVHGDLEFAKKVLNDIKNNPNPNWLEKQILETHTNIRIETVDKSDAWWNW